MKLVSDAFLSAFVADMRATVVCLAADAREVLSTAEFIHQCRDMERAIGSKVSWQSILGVGTALAGGLGIFNDLRLTSAKEVLQKDMELKHQELKHGLENVTEQLRELNNLQQPKAK